MIVILMGVSGSGKTHVGKLLAERTGWALFEADDFHPEGNIEKMSRGIPLEDADRWPWLGKMRIALTKTAKAGESAVATCSALKRSYREFLADGLPGEVMWVLLFADQELIEQRMRGREHFFPPSLLESQLRTLEIPDPGEALVIDADQPAEDIVDAILATIER
ncbi:MAG: gluconokinase [Phycisphaeraceae bacterium]